MSSAPFRRSKVVLANNMVVSTGDAAGSSASPAVDAENAFASTAAPAANRRPSLPPSSPTAAAAAKECLASNHHLVSHSLNAAASPLAAKPSSNAVDMSINTSTSGNGKSDSYSTLLELQREVDAISGFSPTSEGFMCGPAEPGRKLFGADLSSTEDDVLATGSAKSAVPCDADAILENRVRPAVVSATSPFVGTPPPAPTELKAVEMISISNSHGMTTISNRYHRRQKKVTTSPSTATTVAETKKEEATLAPIPVTIVLRKEARLCCLEGEEGENTREAAASTTTNTTHNQNERKMVRTPSPPPKTTSTVPDKEVSHPMPPSRPTLTGASGNPRPILLYGFECSVSSDDDEEKGVHAHEGSGADTDEDYYYEEEEASNMVRYSERLEQDAHVNEDRPNSPVSPRRRRGMQDDEDAASAWSSGACTPCSPERKRDFAGVEEEHAEVEHHGNNNNNNTNKSNTMPGVDCVEAVTPQQDKKQGEKRTATSLQDVIQAMKLSIQSPVVISPSACILMSADDIGTKQHSTPASSTTSHSNTNNGSKEDMTRPSAYVFKTSTPAAVTAYASDDDEEAPPILCEAAVYQSSANSPTPKHPSSHGHPPMIRPGLTTSLSVGGFSSTPTLSRGNSHDSVNSTAVVDTSLIRLELDPRLAAALSASTDSVLSSREEDAGSGVSSRKNSDEAGEIRREIRTAMPTGGAALESMIASQSADEQLAQNAAKARSWVTAHKSYLQVTLQEHRRSIVAVAAELYEEWWGRRYVLDRATGQFYFKEIAPATLSGAVPAPPPLPPPPPPAAAAGAAGPSTPRSAATAAQENWRLHRNVGDVVQPSTPSVVVDSPLSPLQILAECRVSRRSVNLIDPMAVQLVTGPCSGTEALFRLSPTLPVAKQTELLSAFVDDQLEMYDRQVHHLMFDVLYTRIVAIPATLMLERHERRLLCMRRDLYLRDAIDLFMLTAPKRVQLSPIEIDIQNIKSRLHSWLRDSPKPSSHTAVIHPRGGSTIERAESFEQYNWTSRRSYLDNAYTTMPPGGITVSCVEKGKRSSVVMKAEIISPVTPTPAASHFFNTEDAIRDGASQGKREEHQVRISSFTQGGGVGGSRSSSDGNVLTSTVTVHAAVRRSPAITTRVSGSVLPAIHSRPQRPTVMRATERHGIKPASHQMARKRRQGHVSEDQFDSIEALRTPVL